MLNWFKKCFSPQSFGNAEAIYRLGNLQLRFLRNRSDDTLSIGSSSNPRHFYNIEDVAVWMGWISLDDLLKYNTPIRFDQPPPGPFFTLPKAMSLIVKDLKLLDKAFSPSEILSTHAKLKDAERKRMSAR